MLNRAGVMLQNLLFPREGQKVFYFFLDYRNRLYNDRVWHYYATVIHKMQHIAS